MKRLWGIALVLGAVGLAVAVLRLAPAQDFLFIPNKASPLAGLVSVEGATPTGKGDVYFVDVFVRRTSRLEQWLPFTRPDGSTLVRAQDYLPQGTSEAEHVDQTEEEIRRSELIAPAVAMSALGYKVVERPQGALVIGVAADAPAAGKLEEGDVIVAVDGTPIHTTSELRARIGKRKPGEDVTLTVRRGGREGRKLVVTIGTIPAPDNPKRPIVGIQVDQAADIVLPRKVKIDLGAVRGPSAGLPFALEVARELGRNVTHGCRVAATGELDLEGDVLPVGGVKQKVIGAHRTGVDVFLVPAGDNAAEAQSNADGLRIVPVDSFQQALRYLATKHLKC